MDLNILSSMQIHLSFLFYTLYKRFYAICVHFDDLQSYI